MAIPLLRTDKEIAEIYQRHKNTVYRVMKGIFMPIKYAEDSIIQSNDATLYLLDLAEYGMLDGVRWMFLETKYGLVYCKDSYPSLAGAGNLEDIKEILREKLK